MKTNKTVKSTQTEADEDSLNFQVQPVVSSLSQHRRPPATFSSQYSQLSGRENIHSQSLSAQSDAHLRKIELPDEASGT